MSLFARNAILAFVMALTLGGIVFYTVDYFNRMRLAEISAIEDQISIDTLSLDTQFSLLAATPCESVASSTTLSSELADLGSRLSYAEEQLGSGNQQVIRLKKQYSLLEMRDYLLTKQFAAKCATKPVTVLYFYSNAGDCADCDKAGYALSYLHTTYPALRVYSFDYNLDLGALKTLLAITKLEGDLPAFVIDGKTSYGFTTLEDLQQRFPKGALATSTPTAR